ncbi:MAG: thiamine-phosphate kinase [Methanoregulaceae archaeon]|nr:thiamine-phosphate kinase [Methanoregulaceae archaeon]
MDERELKQIVRNVIGIVHTLDDCAVVPCGDDLLVFTTDMLHEKTDFPPGITDWQIGWMSAAVTLSDIAAMGARPGILLLAIGLDRGSRLRDILEGAKACCSAAGAVLAGGDLDSHHELTIVSSGLGFAHQGMVVRRQGSRPGDRICITGPLGRAQAALEGFDQYRQALFQPFPRVKEGLALAEAGVTSMMDISDGLVLSLYDLLDANACGYSVKSSLLPALEGLDLQRSREFSLYGGGDYELLFTCPPDRLPVQAVEYWEIGEVIADHEVRVDGKGAPCQGYLHRWSQ